MIDIYCDESHDDHTYALGGWIATPSAWNLFNPAWNQMLARHHLPDGSPMPAFHAAEIVGRDFISDSRWRGWTFEQEKAAFSDAIDIVVHPKLCANMWSVGVSVALPVDIVWPFGVETSKDAIWGLLFTRLFLALLDAFPAQQGFSFMFDEKPEVMQTVATVYSPAKRLLDSWQPGKLARSVIAFASDEDNPPLQAADLFVYEWRRRISDKRTHPQKSPRRSYVRIREVRSQHAALYHYNTEAVRAITQRAVAGESFLKVMSSYPTTVD